MYTFYNPFRLLSHLILHTGAAWSCMQWFIIKIHSTPDNHSTGDPVCQVMETERTFTREITQTLPRASLRLRLCLRVRRAPPACFWCPQHRPLVLLEVLLERYECIKKCSEGLCTLLPCCDGLDMTPTLSFLFREALKSSDPVAGEKKFIKLSI